MYPYSTSNSQMVLRDMDLLLKSIASRVPASYITWYNKGGDFPSDKAEFEIFSKALHITNVSEEDQTVFCSISNKMSRIQYIISVRVKAAPHCLHELKNLILSPGEDGRLVCRAKGNPKSTLQ